jgi:predicted AAA+ superfamily ATPase
MLDEIFSLSQTFLHLRNRIFRRYFLQETVFSNRFSIVVGQRGIGKTTAMIQYLLEQADGDRFSPKILYVQADHFLLSRTSLYEIADEFYHLGGKLICFDEIHKYRDWSMELKSIFDTFPDLRMLASGSSALEIAKGSHDLSRRALLYRMHGLSFREYLGLNCEIHFDKIPLATLLDNHQRTADSVITDLSRLDLKILALFKEYLATGYYPYFQDFNNKEQFYLTIEQNIHTTLEADLPAIHQTLNGTSIHKIKHLLAIVSSLVPYTPDMKHLKNLLEIGDERTLKNYLKLLEDAGIVLTVGKSGKGLRALEKPEKIYLNNPTLYHALAGTSAPDSGAVRETFFLTMLRVAHQVSVPLKGDFLVDDHIIFEVGGKNKDAAQIQGIDNAWLALDSIEIGTGNRIPLWLFGFLY